VDLSELKDILRMLEEQDITEFELEHDGVKLRVCRSGAPTAAPPPVPVTSVAPPPNPPSGTPLPAAAPASGSPLPPVEEGAAAQTAEEPEANNGTPVSSPIVGTFYRAPDPNSPPLVNVGDHVQVGQVLCIIEAMKLMNEIEAEVAGEIVRIHPENGQPVQYGDPLFTIRSA
jgi:acetyl-CoA carboxylase biotin carboxyl carrier protein